MKNKFKKIIIIVVLLLLIIFISCFIYFEIYYHADSTTKKYLESSENVKVTNNSKYIFFDGKGENNAIIFYPGAKVESESYARLMNKLAENDIDCFLLKFPFRFAFFGENYPDNILQSYDYDSWYLAGHSLGGVVASYYLKDNKNIKGIIYLASYPSIQIDDDLKTISIYGNNDNVLNMDSYKKAQWPKNYQEYIIKDGNHSGFANYGNQKGDSKRVISNNEQQDQTVDIIVNELINNN